MATAQTTSKKSGSSQASASRTRGASMGIGKPDSSGTNERDENYDLISVLFHSLKGAETCAKFLRDATESGDEDLITFFEETRAEYNERATEAKWLLASRLSSLGLGDEGEDEDQDDEEEDDEDLGDEEDDGK